MPASDRSPIYLDHAATTPLDPRVFEAMRPYFCDLFGNPASAHGYGREAERSVERARAEVAALLNAADSDEVVFTSGATESNNLAIRGVAEAPLARGRRHLVTQVTEHKAVVDPMKRLAREGWEVTWLGVDDFGRVTPAQVAEAIRPDTLLVSVMWANNETGTVQPTAEIARVCAARGVLLHSDATQAVGKVPVDVRAAGVDLLSLSAHKFYGPKGSGGLYVRRGDPPVALSPLLLGGGHERGLRSGTLNVPAIVGLGAACKLAADAETRAAEATRVAALRDRLEQAILAGAPAARINGHPDHRLPHISSLSFPGADGDALFAALDEHVAVSAASACASGQVQSSYVLRAMGIPEPLARATIRFSLGRSTTDEDVGRAAARVLAALRGAAAAGA